MSNIKTREVTTKSKGIKAVIKEAITYGENQEIMDVYRDDKLSRSEAARKANKLGVEKIIISIDGVTENIYEVFKELELPDALELTDEVKKILDPKGVGK